MGHATLEKIEIRPIRVREAHRARQLILTGLQEKWGDPDPSRNPDLDDIVASYSNGVFLVAIFGSEIIGTDALVPEAESIARIVRMWVAQSYRGRGVGTEILEQLLKAASIQGYRRVVVETTAAWADAVEFYKNRGFVPVGVVGDDMHFQLELDASQA